MCVLLPARSRERSGGGVQRGGGEPVLLQVSCGRWVGGQGGPRARPFPERRAVLARLGRAGVGMRAAAACAAPPACATPPACTAPPSCPPARPPSAPPPPPARTPCTDSDEFLPVATTRPETILGDTAVAVHPEDDRWVAVAARQAGGREASLQAAAWRPRCCMHRTQCAHAAPAPTSDCPTRAPSAATSTWWGGRRWCRRAGAASRIIADEYVDREFGTGALKITPGGWVRLRLWVCSWWCRGRPAGVHSLLRAPLPAQPVPGPVLPTRTPIPHQPRRPRRERLRDRQALQPGHHQYHE